MMQASGEAPSDRQEPQEQPGMLKRPAPSAADQNPQAQKRARRLFGALMGTLAKARCRRMLAWGVCLSLPLSICSMPAEKSAVHQCFVVATA